MGTSESNGNAQVKIEVVFPVDKQAAVVSALIKAHPQNKVPYDIMAIENHNSMIGSGMIGELKKPMSEKAFLKKLKRKMKAGVVRYTKPLGKPIQRVALCGGAGGFLLNQAIRQKADIFITSDYKYHEFFDADDQIIIADIGHFESEQFTIDLLYQLIINKFSTFAAHCSKVKTNPVFYL
jgi:putative NIF3 family GTP cyclohydrolase 1 type 2